MTRPITTAMVLAAGLGTRLRPLTNTTPKPLLPLNGTTILEHQLAYLRRGGVEEVVLNLHHLGEQIRARIGDGSAHGLSIRYSEEPTILGTGGGIKQAMADAMEPFFVLNGDALIDADVKTLAARHRKSNAAATMVVKALVGNDHTPVAVSDAERVVGFGEGNHYYTGLQVVGPALLAALPPAGEASCLIRDGYRTLLQEKTAVAAFVHEGYALDVGTLERYEEARCDVAAGRLSP